MTNELPKEQLYAA